MRGSLDLEKYLGLPMIVEQNKKAPFHTILDHIRGKIDGWCNRSLSQGGKMVFIKSVLQSIPTYVMSCFLLPKTFCGDIEATFN